MASSSGGSYTSNQETTNFARLCRIVVDVFRDILWQVLIHEILALDLPNRVRTNQNKLGNLDVKINTWLCGISPSSPEIPTAEKFDVSSLYTLIRNLCSQVPAPSTQWGKSPPPGGTTLGDDIERLREFRNTLFGHATQAKIDTSSFNNLCIEIRNVVSRFDAYFSSSCTAMQCDFQRGIDTILTCSMDKSLQDTYVDKMKEIGILSGGLENVKQHVGNIDPKVGNVEQKVGDVEQKVGDIEQYDRSDHIIKITMAGSSGGSYTFSQETTNFVRMYRIVVDVFRDILWQVLIHEIPAADLPSRVQKDQNKLGKLNVHIKTWLCGIPPSSPEIPTAEKFDVSSLYTLIRNLCSQVPAPSTQWGKSPPPGGTTLGDDIERLREFRNTIFTRATGAHIDTSDFNILCIDIRNVVSRFDAYFSSSCTAMQCDFQRGIDTILTCSIDKSLQAYIHNMEEIVVSSEIEEIKESLKKTDVVENVQLFREDSVIPAEIVHMDEKSILLYREALRSGQVQINNLRIMVVGQYGVGKTTLTKRLLGKEVYISKEKSTEGIEIYKHCCKVSLDKGEWIVQHEDVEQYSRLQCLVKLFNESVQKHKASVEQEIQRRKAHLSDGENQQKETSNVLPTSQETGSSIVELDNKHAGQKTNTSTISLGETMSSKSEMNDAVVKIHDLIKLINKNTDKLEKSYVEYAALTIWDFAGQYVYYTTHQTFLTSRALYLLVIDLSQQVTYPIEGDKVFLDIEGIKQCRVHDMIEIWLNTIHFCAPSPKSGIPPVILVGTHVDKIPEKSRQEVIDKYFKSVYCMLGEKPILIHLKGDIAIDNNLCDANPGLEELKRMIFELAKKQPHWGEKRPARWIPMEQAIMALKHSGSKVVARSLLADINRRDSVGIDDKDELDLFLKFHHEIGTILYFSVDELKENIILEPQWMIDALKSLITADTLIRRNPAIASKWKEFNEKGKLTQELLDAVWSEENNLEFLQHKDFIVKLMEKLNILAKPLSQKDGKGAQVENYFLAPCMLKEATPVEFISPIPKESVENTSVLCYVFKENFLPPPIFHRLIAACVAQWPIARNGSENLIYCGCCVYQLDDHHRLTLFFREHVIFVRVTSMGTVEKNQSYKLCIEAKEFITSNLSNVIRHLGRSVQFQIYIRCPKSEGYSVESLVPVADLQTNVDIPCYSHGNGGHLIISCQVLKFWFQEVKQPVIRSKEDENQPKGSNQESPIPRKQSRKDTAQQKRRLHCDKDRPASTKRNQAKKRTLLHESSSDLSSDSESEIVASSDSESGSEDEVVSHTCKRKTKTKKWKKLKKKQKRRNMQDIPKSINYVTYNIDTIANSNIGSGGNSLNSIDVSTQKDGVKFSSAKKSALLHESSSDLSSDSEFEIAASSDSESGSEDEVVSHTCKRKTKTKKGKKLKLKKNQKRRNTQGTKRQWTDRMSSSLSEESSVVPEDS